MTGDIDIDVPPNFDFGKLFPKWCRASMVKDGELVPHNCGVYPHSMPIDPVSGCSAIPYEAAEELGYFKIDFLHLNVYKHFSSQQEIDDLVKKEPDWNLLLLPSTHLKLFQLANHGDLLMDLKPKSILELADVLALIRPGKKVLVNLYKKSKAQARLALWSKSGESYSFKKSHALGYSYVIVLQLHLIEQGRL